MHEAPRRKRFQINLSTAIVMMLVAGALIWANVYPQPHYFRGDPDGNGNIREVSTILHGWPIPGMTMKEVRLGGQRREFFDNLSSYPIETYVHFLLDAMTAFLVLIAVYFLCERLIRKEA